MSVANWGLIVVNRPPAANSFCYPHKKMNATSREAGGHFVELQTLSHMVIWRHLGAVGGTWAKIGSDKWWFMLCWVHTEKICIVCVGTIPGVSQPFKADNKPTAGRKGVFIFTAASCRNIGSLMEGQWQNEAELGLEKSSGSLVSKEAFLSLFWSFPDVTCKTPTQYEYHKKVQHRRQKA